MRTNTSSLLASACEKCTQFTNAIHSERERARKRQEKKLKQMTNEKSE